MYEDKPCCPASAMRKIRQIDIGGSPTGLFHLDETFQEVYDMKIQDEKKLKKELLEAYKKLDKEKYGLFCTSAIAAGVPKHRRSTESTKRIIVIDGCCNKCTKKILEKDGFKINKYLNPFLDLKIPKIGPFKPFDYSKEDLEKTVEEIIKLCEEK